MMSIPAVLTALADPTRRRVFETLRHGPRSVGVLAAQLPVSRPAVSQHLRVLKEARLVRDRPEGTRRLYSVDTAGLAELRTYIDGFWDDVLGAYAEAARRHGGGRDGRRRE